MRFRLTYEGELRATQRDPRGAEPDKLALHKHAIRRQFHGQLRRLWQTNRFLSEHKVWPKDYALFPPPDGVSSIADIPAKGTFYWGGGPDTRIPLIEALAAQRQNNRFNYRFVPLVRDGIFLLCSLDILFLRRDIPGSLIQAGDIDNRIKTLIDALRCPQSANEIPLGAEPRAGDDPFFCLLEDDKFVSHFAVETDTLLDPITDDDADRRKVKLVITVELRPYHVTSFNVAFAS
jgi:hypothetical protein